MALSPLPYGRCVVVDDDPAHTATAHALHRDEISQWELSAAASRRRAQLSEAAAAISVARGGAAAQTRDREATVMRCTGQARVAALGLEGAERRLADAQAAAADAGQRVGAASLAVDAAKAKLPQPQRDEADAAQHYREMLEAAKWPRRWLKRVSGGRASVTKEWACDRDKRQAAAAEADAIERDAEAQRRVSDALARLNAAAGRRGDAEREVAQCEELLVAAQRERAQAEDALSEAAGRKREAEATVQDRNQSRDIAEQDLQDCRGQERRLQAEDEQASKDLMTADAAARRAEQCHRDAAIACTLHASSPRRTRLMWEPSPGVLSPFSTSSSIGYGSQPASPPSGGERRSNSPRRLRWA